MQRPNPDSIYYDEFIQLQKKLRDRILLLRKSRDMVQEEGRDTAGRPILGMGRGISGNFILGTPEI